ncbi:MAG: CDP-glycerol glycerophosphotransferase family protein [Clostridia bacterium]|nr:CDP-glycerol glycerophosphotransferase family protein [Clostridia bacterium]
MGFLRRGFDFLKMVLLEKGHLIYWCNIPSFIHTQRRVRRVPSGDKIRIGFILQVPNNWAVVESLYLAAKADPEVEPVILLMPEVDFQYYLRMTGVHPESVLRYAEGHFTESDRCISVYDPKSGAWTDPKSLALDYVFIPRPYDTYLPRPYRASRLRRITRVAYVPYSTPLMDDWNLMYNMHFIRNLSLIFCEKQFSYDYVRARLRPTVRSGDTKVFLTGFPKFDLNTAASDTESPLWPRKKSRGIMRVIWTPRWTTDPRLGATSFFTFMEQMPRLARECESIDLVFRPHPLAFENFIARGEMTEDEVAAYLAQFSPEHHLALDTSRTYYDLLWSSDVLISDVSSMLLDYLMTGKPILFCPTPAGKTTTEDPRFAIRDILDGLYIVRSFEEIRQTLAMLQGGVDPKRETRLRLAREMHRDGHIGEDILGLIKKDYFGAPCPT